MYGKLACFRRHQPTLDRCLARWQLARAASCGLEVSMLMSFSGGVELTDKQASTLSGSSLTRASTLVTRTCSMEALRTCKSTFFCLLVKGKCSWFTQVCPGRVKTGLDWFLLRLHMSIWDVAQRDNFWTIRFLSSVFIKHMNCDV